MAHFDDYYPKFCNWVGYDNPIDAQISRKAVLDEMVKELKRTGSLDIATELWKEINLTMLLKGSMHFSADIKTNVAIKDDFRARIKRVQGEEDTDVIARELLMRYMNFYHNEIYDNFVAAKDALVVGQDKKQFIGAEGKFESIYTRMNSRLSASELIMLGEGDEEAKRKMADMEFRRMTDTTAWNYLYSLTYFAYDHYYFGRPQRQIQPVPLAAPGREEIQHIREPEDLKKFIEDTDAIEQRDRNQQAPPSQPPEQPATTMPEPPFPSPPPEPPTPTMPAPPEPVQNSPEPSVTAEQSESAQEPPAQSSESTNVLSGRSEKVKRMDDINDIKADISVRNVNDALSKIGRLNPPISNPERVELAVAAYEYCLQSASLYGIMQVAEEFITRSYISNPEEALDDLRQHVLEVIEVIEKTLPGPGNERSAYMYLVLRTAQAIKLFSLPSKDMDPFKGVAATAMINYITADKLINEAVVIADAFQIRFTDLEPQTKKDLIYKIKQCKEGKIPTDELENVLGITEADLSENSD